MYYMSFPPDRVPLLNVILHGKLVLHHRSEPKLKELSLFCLSLGTKE